MQDHKKFKQQLPRFPLRHIPLRSQEPDLQRPQGLRNKNIRLFNQPQPQAHSRRGLQLRNLGLSLLLYTKVPYLLLPKPGRSILHHSKRLLLRTTLHRWVFLHQQTPLDHIHHLHLQPTPLRPPIPSLYPPPSKVVRDEAWNIHRDINRTNMLQT